MCEFAVRTSVRMDGLDVAGGSLWGCFSYLRLGNGGVAVTSLLVLGVYAAVFFGTAVLLPPVLYPIRLGFGYASYIVFGGLILGIFFPVVSETMLTALNAVVKMIWNTIE